MSARQLAFPFMEVQRGIRTKPPHHKRRMTRSSVYEWYMNSDLWQKKREEAFRVRGESCERCGRGRGVPGNPLQVHHTNYHRFGTFGNEDPERDLLILCMECHELLHSFEELTG